MESLVCNCNATHTTHIRLLLYTIYFFTFRYGNEEQCGVLGEEIFLYSLCVPIVTIAMLNMVLFVLTMRKMGKGWHFSKYVCKCCRRGVTADCNQLNDPRMHRLNR